jgi:hypothetical protein
VSSGSGCRVWGLGGWGTKFRVWSLELRVWGLEF